MKAIILYLFFAMILFCAGSCNSSGGMESWGPYYAERAPDGPVPGGKVRLTFMGTTSLLIDDGETQLLIDGFFTRPPLFKALFSRLSTDQNAVKRAMARARMDRLRAVFLSHSHYDHAMDTPAIIRMTGALLYGTSSSINIGRGGGLPEDRMRLFDPGREIPLGKFRVTVIPSKHTPLPFYLKSGGYISAPLAQPARANAYREGGTYDILVRRGARSILFHGSTNYREGALAPYRADVIILGTARLGRQNAAFREAYWAESAARVKARMVIPVHWDNFFRPLDSPLVPTTRLADDVPAGMDFLIRKARENGMTLKIMRAFDSILLF